LNLVPASPGGNALDAAWARGTPCPLLPDDVSNEALNTMLMRGPWSLSCRARRNTVQDMGRTHGECASRYPLPVLATLQRVLYHHAAQDLPAYDTVAQKEIPQKNLAGFNIAPSVPRALWRLVTSTSPRSFVLSCGPISRGL
jgi:hypothetical protein